MKHKITWILIILNLVVFLLVFSLPGTLQECPSDTPFCWVFDTFSFSFATKFEIWRWITSLFLHVSASHLFFNMLGLYFFGKIMEDEVPKQWFLSVYFVAGVLGNFVFMFTSASPVVGASGAMFGIIGATMLLKPLKRIHLYLFPLPLGLIAVMFLIFETFVVYFQPKEFANVANIAHVAGLITGSVFAMFHSPKTAIKGVGILIICVILLLLLGPIFSIITGIGALILNVIEMAIGFILYNIAALISFIWV